MLQSPSDEQKEVLTYFNQGYNVKIEAVAGSGKTTTLLLLASEAKHKFNARTLILTYNRDLKDEVTTKVKDLSLGFNSDNCPESQSEPTERLNEKEKSESVREQIDLKITKNTESLREQHKISNNSGQRVPIKLIGAGCDVYTYHGFASRLYGQNIYNDVKLREALNEQIEPVPYDIILLDEVQDMNVDYYTLICRILSHAKMLVLVGDRRQCINEYMGATSEYLVNYKKYFDTGRPWKELMLRTSYRLTPSIAKFVNDHVLGEQIIIPGNKTNKDCKPIYSYGVWDIEKLVTSSVKTYGPNDVVIILPSVRNINPKSPIGRLCAKRQSNILFCIKDGDASTETMMNKVLITSYNSMKGRERKCVIVVGFDESYFEYYDRKWNNQNILLPNIIYVAATRARESLILVQDDKKPPFRTVNTNKLGESCEVRGGFCPDDRERDIRDKTYTVCDLTRHRNTNDTCNMLQLLNIKTIKPADEPLPYENIIQFNGYYEDMRQYYAILIPLLAQYKRTGSLNLPLVISKRQSEPCDELKIRFNNLMDRENKSLKEWMELVVIYTSLVTKCHFYAYQITHYNWVDENFISKQVDRILSTFPEGEGSFKYALNVKDSDIEGGLGHRQKYNLEGSVDYFGITGGMWDFKCSTSLSDEHKLQCGAYISMYNIQTGLSLPCKLFNTRTGEILEITVTDSNKYLDILLRNKRHIATNLTLEVEQTLQKLSISTNTC